MLFRCQQCSSVDDSGCPSPSTRGGCAHGAMSIHRHVSVDDFRHSVEDKIMALLARRHDRLATTATEPVATAVEKPQPTTSVQLFLSHACRGNQRSTRDTHSSGTCAFTSCVRVVQACAAFSTMRGQSTKSLADAIRSLAARLALVTDLEDATASSVASLYGGTAVSPTPAPATDSRPCP